MDDAVIGGDAEATAMAYKDLDRLLGFGDREVQNLSKILGTHYEEIQPYFDQNGDQINASFLHQKPVVHTTIQRYKDEIGQKGPFKAAHSPSCGKSEALDASLEDKEGLRKDTAAMHVGALTLIARGEREDIAESVGVLCRHLKEWTMMDGMILFRLMAYLETTKT